MGVQTQELFRVHHRRLRLASVEKGCRTSNEYTLPDSVPVLCGRLPVVVTQTRRVDETRSIIDAELSSLDSL